MKKLQFLNKMYQPLINKSKQIDTEAFFDAINAITDEFREKYIENPERWKIGDTVRVKSDAQLERSHLEMHLELLGAIGTVVGVEAPNHYNDGGIDVMFADCEFLFYSDMLEPALNVVKPDPKREAIAQILHNHLGEVEPLNSELVNELYRMPNFIDWDSIREEFSIWHQDGGFPPAEKVYQWFKEKLS